MHYKYSENLINITNFRKTLAIWGKLMYYIKDIFMWCIIYGERVRDD